MSEYFGFKSQGSGLNAKEHSTKGEGIVQGNTKVFGYWGLAFS